LKISAKKGCFQRFEWEKTNFITSGPPRNILEKSPCVPPLWKNPSDAHPQNPEVEKHCRKMTIAELAF